MKTLNKIVMGCAALVLLTGCATKCTFEKFQTEAKAAAQKESGYAKAVVKGTADATTFGVSISFKFDHTFVKTENGWTLSKGEEGAAAVAAAALIAYRAVDFAQAEDKDCTYYCGAGFKIVEKNDDGESTWKFDRFGYVTSVKGKAEGMNADVTVKWSK